MSMWSLGTKLIDACVPKCWLAVIRENQNNCILTLALTMRFKEWHLSNAAVISLVLCRGQKSVQLKQAQ